MVVYLVDSSGQGQAGSLSTRQGDPSIPYWGSVPLLHLVNVCLQGAGLQDFCVSLMLKVFPKQNIVPAGQPHQANVCLQGAGFYHCCVLLVLKLLAKQNVVPAHWQISHLKTFLHIKRLDT